ncbi:MULTISPECIES: phosphoribosyltransferase family protein [unclassified Cryobacterium]|uniref:phosphoribosyltransferase family protein n=1 Tax=unclassified Cryobacterium TaxID=2649013 RepID=UPI002AB49EC2|nr:MULTISPECIES: phosphoribosyltransferase family protein [unclassified Cryobacterium]MDY7544125.1 phosphoribosyltransferase family protein [Cryobacterium sp. 5B3]MEB0265166.1 phosphoribosyltransferase family protein [Cryobacterium sp. 10I5]MEB0276390.1 phosphoribosyltransferase family protein [Cryobacterium sp. 5B3]
MVLFSDRVDAGRQLAERLEYLRGTDTIVLGLPRGGVPVAAEVARVLGAPLDVIVVRKLGVPFQPELAMGAIGEGGVRELNPDILTMASISEDELATVERRERGILDARVAELRKGRERIDVRGRTVVIVDDGIATGATARAAGDVARLHGAERVILAVPVASAESLFDLSGFDELVCVHVPRRLVAVGNHYIDFAATTDDEVTALLDAAARRIRTGRHAGGSGLDRDVEIPVGSVVLEGHLYLPENAPAVVVFAHGSGSSRHSPRNQFVADVLHRAGLGTLLLDLLTPGEESDRANVFDVGLLAGRLAAATEWLLDRPDTRSCRIGYFGASTGAGAALWAAADADDRLAAIVSRGGRPDLAGDRLPEVTAPTLLIVGGADPGVLDLNRRARTRMRCRNRLAVIEGATHLFEEPGALATAANLASDWFVSYLLAAPDSSETGESAGLVGVAGGDDATELRAQPESDVQH